jgi:hypothetical protein
MLVEIYSAYFHGVPPQVKRLTIPVAPKVSLLFPDDRCKFPFILDRYNRWKDMPNACESRFCEIAIAYVALL